MTQSPTSPVALPPVVPEDAPGLQLTPRGLHFTSSDTERTYLLWHAREALPHMRVGVLGNVLGWVVLLAGWGLVRAPSFGTAAAGAGIGLSMSAVRLAILRRPRLVSWASPTAVFTLPAQIAIVLGLFWWILSMPDAALYIVLMGNYFGFTIMRLRPGPAVCGVLPFVLFNQVLLIVAAHSGQMTTPLAVSYSGIAVLAFATGLMACLATERGARERFRQERIIEAQGKVIADERDRADRLLMSILPQSIAERLKASPRVIADRIEEVTVVFIDVVGFTTLAASVSPEALVEILDEVFTRFDDLAVRFGVEKIKTIGDAYMAVAGLPEPREDHATAAAGFALAAREALAAYRASSGRAIEVRVGMSTGPVVAGVIGTRKFAYDLWGDTVNTAARMESHGVAGEIQVSEATYRKLAGRYRFEERGMIEVKGKGPMAAWLLAGDADSSASP